MELHYVIWVVSCIIIITSSISGEFINNQHQTEGAKMKKHDVWCYKCDTMDDGDRCSNLSAGNESKLVYKCPEHRTICMVKRYSYTTSTENSTSVLRMWSLERNCTSRCEPGCIVIGERTKLYACTTCCERSLCNTGTGGASSLRFNILTDILIPAILPMSMRINRLIR
ncbi:uncharacterized protein LOC128983104 [Macrosteles quadrilineatus]|uniref:uncharacterized protein LOC128983104 n=1 Tax=Macrosteles quadrilineatus TaxID=74068 RepID=UPI0023E1F43F|nr:uncharacterized protein LOC128983104 [Macrosteles quadrilineatus]